MEFRQFQAKINQSIVLAKRLLEEIEKTGDAHIDISMAVYRYLDDNGIHVKGADIREIRQRGALLRNEPEHKVLLGVRPPEDWVDPQYTLLVNRYGLDQDPSVH